MSFHTHLWITGINTFQWNSVQDSEEFFDHVVEEAPLKRHPLHLILRQLGIVLLNQVEEFFVLWIVSENFIPLSLFEKFSN